MKNTATNNATNNTNTTSVTNETKFKFREEMRGEQQCWRMVYTCDQEINIRGHKFQVKAGDLGPLFYHQFSLDRDCQVIYGDSRTYIPRGVTLGNEVALINCNFTKVGDGWGKVHFEHSVIKDTSFTMKEKSAKVTDSLIENCDLTDVDVNGSTVKRSTLNWMKVESSRVNRVNGNKHCIRGSKVYRSNITDTALINACVVNAIANLSTIENSSVRNSVVDWVTLNWCRVSNVKELYRITIENSIVMSDFPKCEVKDGAYIHDALIEKPHDAGQFGEYFYYRRCSRDLSYVSGLHGHYKHTEQVFGPGAKLVAKRLGAERLAADIGKISLLVPATCMAVQLYKMILSNFMVDLTESHPEEDLSKKVTKAIEDGYTVLDPVSARLLEVPEQNLHNIYVFPGRE